MGGARCHCYLRPGAAVALSNLLSFPAGRKMYRHTDMTGRGDKHSASLTTPRSSPQLPLFPPPCRPGGSIEALLSCPGSHGVVAGGVRACWAAKMECPADNVNKHTWLRVVVGGDVTRASQSPPPAAVTSRLPANHRRPML